ncbi:MAG: hypothetical protein ACRET3_12940, partial [Burkholderiales bacterium]
MGFAGAAAVLAGAVAGFAGAGVAAGLLRASGFLSGIASLAGAGARATLGGDGEGAGTGAAAGWRLR